MLGALGSVAGCVFAVWSIAFIRATFPLSMVRYIGGWEQFRLNPRALIYGLLIAGVAGLLVELLARRFRR